MTQHIIKLSNHFSVDAGVSDYVKVKEELTSDDTVLVLPQLQHLLMQLVVLPDHPGIVCPVRFQNSVEISALFLSLTG